MTEKKVVEKVAAVDSKAVFAAKVDSAALITSIQKDLLRVHDFAMSQERSTTFVLADFTLQLKAVVTQEGEKTLFALPTRQGDLDPNTMSTLSLTLRPIPLEVKAASSRKPVEAVEGIGPVIGARLRDLGIETVSDLAIASCEDLVKADVTRKKAAEFISMAKLMVKSNLAGVEGVDEQVAELLVVGGNIDSKEKLAQTTPEELVNILDTAIKSGKVKVPKTFHVSVDDSKRWVDSAKTIVNRTISPRRTHMSVVPENASLGDLVRDLLLAMVSSQNEANKTFIADIKDLAGTDVTINYTKNVDGKKENREIKGNALAFGVMPTLLTIQSSVIEVRTALSVTKNTASTGAPGKNLRERTPYLFKTSTVDAKYQNTYSYKAETSSVIRITVVPTPPSQELLDTIKSLTNQTPIADNPKP